MTTPNFGWPLIQPTDFVTDLPADFETFADAVDADLAGLLGGTTGQVLTKASGTDHDFAFASPAVSPITTEGDLIVGDATGVAIRLPVGSAGQVLTSDGDTVSFVTPASGGKVLQVVSAAISSSATIATSTFTDTNITLNITPTLATSKILVIVFAKVKGSKSGNRFDIGARIMRDATSVFATTRDAFLGFDSTGPTFVNIQGYFPLQVLDSPATTSAVTYKVQGATEDATNTAVWQSLASSVITLMEIGV